MGALSTFPLSFKVANRRVVIVGGGEEALAKARLVAKTRAHVVVVSRQPRVGFGDYSGEVHARAFAASDLDGAALVFVADHGPDGEAAQAEARARGIPINVVDHPEACDFYTPAIVDRAPVSVAISTEGDAPVLARLVRARVEAVLSPNLGGLARLAGEMRERVSRMIGSASLRRRYYEDLLGSATVDAALERGAPDGRREAMRLLDRYAGDRPGNGIVWLIGAGPGAEDLLTLRAQRLLQEADVIVHDGLVPDAVVQMGRRDAERIAVGKAKGRHSASQEQINALLVKLAAEGKKVARLKSGDPMVFGRAGEELAALRSAGIAYAIVPGITAALAAAADSATPVTLRGVASGLVMATAHAADNAEVAHWAGLAREGLTLCIYMGKSVAAEVASQLIANGLKARTPVGIAVNAGRVGRSFFRGTLDQLADGAVGFPDGPALILIGEAVAHGDWRGASALAGRVAAVA
ncbi:MAG TPA: siroheme synthase CysG [Devosiaceae bacterium]